MNSTPNGARVFRTLEVVYMTKSLKFQQDTRLEAEGAEFLVLGNLLIHGVACFKAYTNFQGYDLVAVNPNTRKSARIQVKSRWATDYDGKFPIKNFDCDFVVHVALNRGYKRTHTDKDPGIRAPIFWVFPVKILQAVVEESGGWHKVSLKNISKTESYKDNWNLISRFVGSR